jgi:hypothetical protein
MVHQIKLNFCVCFILTILLHRYEMSKSKKLIASWLSKNRQLTLVLGFRGSCIVIIFLHMSFGVVVSLFFIIINIQC